MKRSLIRSYLYTFFLCGLTSLTNAQDIKSLLNDLKRSKRDTNRALILIEIGKYYNKPRGHDQTKIDSALIYFNAAAAFSSAIRSADFLHRAMAEKGLLLISRENFTTGDSIFKAITDYYHRNGDYAKEAYYWTLYGNSLPYNDPRVLATRANCYNVAYRLYSKGTDRLKIADALGKIADADLNEGRYDKAEREMLLVIKEYKALKFKRIYYGYYLLAEVYSRKNQIQKELLSRIECMNSCDGDENRSDNDAAFFNITLAITYRQNGKDSIALTHFLRGVDLATRIKNQSYYYLAVDGVIGCNIALKRYKTALVYLNTTPNQFPSQSLEEHCRFLARKMQLYNFLGKDTEAENLVPSFKRAFTRLYATLDHDLSFYAVAKYIRNYDALPQHFIQTRQWGRLSDEIRFLKRLPLKRMLAPSRITLYRYVFKNDSASGKTALALKEYQLIGRMQDSLNNAATAKQINELEASYNSIKKDKTIQTLNNNSAIQKGILDKVNMQRNITFAGVLISIIFAMVIFVAYRAKQRSNIRLQAKQHEINCQNAELSNLLSEKERLLVDKDDLLEKQDNLLTEKEWLLREVHHRVKNNLQMVMSLLYNQSAYLQNADARDAIKNSQNRVQAISIIHQKLYKKNNVATIVISDYINDLIRYLSTCYDCNRVNITFIKMLEPVNLDISQAVPVGLILNEAITNSIKYAFSEVGGEIIVKALLTSPDTMLLSIADNGRGLPTDFGLNETSLGMEMMKALTKQLGGIIEVKNDHGVIVSIKFKIEMLTPDFGVSKPDAN